MNSSDYLNKNLFENDWYKAALRYAQITLTSKVVGYKFIDHTSTTIENSQQLLNIIVALLTSIHYRIDSLESKLATIQSKQEDAHILQNLSELSEDLAKLSLGPSITEKPPPRRRHREYSFLYFGTPPKDPHLPKKEKEIVNTEPKKDE